MKNHFKTLIFFLLFISNFVSASDVCGVGTGYSQNPLVAGTSFAKSDSVTNSSTYDNYYFKAPTAGKVTISLSGSNVAFYSSLTTCPISGTAQTSQTLTLSSSDLDFNVRVYRSSGTGTKTYTLTVTYALPTLSIANSSLTEGNSGTSTMNFTVTLSQSATATVNYATSDGTATAGSDYTATSGTLSFNNETSKTIPVPIIGDTAVENNETFIVTLSNPSGATISTATATGSILNDDNPTVTIGEREFAIRNPTTTRNIKGGLKVIGNTVLCVPQTDRWGNITGTCYDYTGGTSNAYLNLQYIDVDGIDRGTYNNSSQAILSIPTAATIKWAGVYAQGYINNNNSSQVSAIVKDPIYITLPTIGIIESLPEVIDLYANDDDGYSYSTYAPLTSLIGKTGAALNGTVTGAGIKANTGTENTGLGNYGAWVLVVVYEDSNSSLKNISVFDGYKKVANESGFTSVNITPSGFLTPTSGEVKSTLSLFVGEGDKNIDDDKLYVNATAINSTNAFYSTLNGFTAIPSYSNTQGIDIQNYDIGVDGNTSHLQIIGNSATSATITMTSDQDMYFPSMVAFTTELYEPRVCYVEAYYNADGNTTLTSANVGDIITIKTWIANMKKDSSDGNLETAEKVEITMEHDDTNLAYQAESTKIQNVGESAYSSKTDASDSDIATFTSDTNTSVWHIGTGANATNGGDLTPNVTNDAANKAYISFKEKLQTSGDITIANIYKVSYENSSMGLRIGDESPVNIGICKDFNTSIVVSAPLGVFNVVNKNFSSTSDPKDTTDSLNALYTQVAGQDFSVKLLALNSDYITLKSYTGDVNLSLISKPNYASTDTDDQKQAKCDAASSLNTVQTITFASESSKTLTLNYATAYQDVAFKIAYNDSGTRKYVCSRDSFAIRPATYSLATNSANMIGGKNYTLTANALTSASSVSTGYTQSITTSSTDKNATIDLIVPTGCTLDKNSTNMALSFTNGVATNTTFTYNNVGDVNVTVTDNNWTAIDQNSNGDCLTGSTLSTADANGRVGCLIQNTKQFTFSPKQFNNELTVQNFDGGNFTYISNDSNMSAKVLLTTTAVLNDTTTTATNYTTKCYARDINYTLKLINDKTLSNSTAQNRIRYSKDSTKSNLENNATIGQATFNSTEGNFTNGIASNLSMLFNFTRNSTTADNPFKIAKNDFNITSIVDSNGTTGTDFNRTNDQNTTFYYGRVYSTDYRAPSPINTTIRYEVYCKDCNTTTFNAIGTQSPLSIYWYQNSLHVINDGNVTSFDSNTTGIKATTIAYSTTSTINNGSDTTHALTNTHAPYTDRIQMTPSSWLLYNTSSATATTNDFTAEFIRSGNWSGAGSVDRNSTAHDPGKFTNTNDTNRSNRKMNW